MLKSISYYSLSANGLFTFTQSIFSLLSEKDLSSFGMTSFIDKAKKLFTNYESALRRDDVNPLTINVQHADEMRDLRFMALKEYFSACLYRESEEWNQAAEDLIRIIKRYGLNLHRYGMAEESAALSNMIEEMKSGPMNVHIKTIQAEDWLNELEASQHYFEEIRAQRVVETKTDTFTISKTRKPLIDSLRALLQMLDLQYIGTGNPDLGELISHINVLIDQTMISARLSQTHSEAVES